MASENDRLKRLISLDSSLQNINDLDILLERILFETRQFTRADSGTIYLKREDEKKLDFAYSQNDTLQRDLGPGQKLLLTFFTIDINPKSIAGYVADTRQLLKISDVYKIGDDVPYKFAVEFDKRINYKTTSMLTIPLTSQMDEVVGVIQVINAMDEHGKVVPFAEDDELVVNHFGGMASQAIQRAQLTRQILLRMIKMAEMRDPKETHHHVNRVASVSIELYERWAMRQGMTRHEIDRNRDLLRMAAMLHDAGKVGIPDEILKAPRRLNEEEYAIMQTHALQGAQLFKDKKSEFDEVALQVALTHHEKWDGTGYPGQVDIVTGKPLKKDRSGQARRLKGEEIPIYGRVVAIADVYDALSCRRAYKEPWSEADVLEEMRKGAGKHFDPNLIDVFFDAHHQIRQIYEKYPDDTD